MGMRREEDFGKHKEHPSKASFLFFKHPLFSISQSLTPFLSLQFCRSERSSLHRDIMTLTSQIQQEGLISFLSLSALNYCRHALSRQHQANIHSTLSYSNCGSREHIPTEIQHAAVSQLFLYTFVSRQYLSLSLSLSYLPSALLDLIP